VSNPSEPDAGSERAEPLTLSETRVEVASQWLLMWWKFRRHKMAMVSIVLVILLYGVALLGEFLAPFDPEAFNSTHPFAPPQGLRLFNEGRFSPYVCGYDVTVDQARYVRVFTPNCENNKIPLRVFAHGPPYKLMGLFETDIRLFGPQEPEQVFFLLGADRLGRDLYSRLIHGTRISLSIGLISVFLTLLLGITLGGVAGYLGGLADAAVMRAVELIRSVPRIPLWMGLVAAIPLTWEPVAVYFGITVILSFLNWAGLARVVRGWFLALKTNDYVISAWLDGASQMRIILRHILPAIHSYIIAVVTLSIPGTILSETALSFLGLGLRPPTISWGVLLKEAQSVRNVSMAPWLLIPALAVMITVLALNFVGDGLRDAADPYG
jgi:peptide/nickel transport system permease protein